MCIDCLIAYKCIGHIYYISGNHFCSIKTFSCYLCKSWGVVITLVYHVWDVCPY